MRMHSSCVHVHYTQIRLPHRRLRVCTVSRCTYTVSMCLVCTNQVITMYCTLTNCKHNISKHACVKLKKVKQYASGTISTTVVGTNKQKKKRLWMYVHTYMLHCMGSKKNLSHFTHTIPSMSMWGYNDRPSSLAARIYSIYVHVYVHKYIINTAVHT